MIVKNYSDSKKERFIGILYLLKKSECADYQGCKLGIGKESGPKISSKNAEVYMVRKELCITSDRH